MIDQGVPIRSNSIAGPSSQERREQILVRLRSLGSVQVSDLSLQFATSEMTIRRDLRWLEADGLLRRVHGGAVLVPGRSYEPTFSEKSREFVAEKERIGAAAAALVQPGDTIILSPGTTTMAIARHLRSHRNVTVVTSAVNIAVELAANPHLEVLVTGGQLRGTTYALVGALAESSLQGLHVDRLFLGGNGLTVPHGLTTPSLPVAMLDRALARVADEVVVTVDHSKIGRVTLCQTVPIERMHTLVTDTGLTEEERQVFEAAGVRVLLA